MNKYYQNYEFLEDFKAIPKNFVGGKLENRYKNEISASHVEKNKINPSEISLKPKNPYSHIRVQLQDDDAIRNELLGHSHNWNREGDFIDSLTKTQYFAEASSGDSQIFLENPSARRNTQNGVFGSYPCSGGVKGTPTYVKPGSKLTVQWQVQNPAENGKWVIKMSERDSESLSSYSIMRPINLSTDGSGYFAWGNSTSGIESAEIAIPSTEKWSQWTLQLGYKVDGTGEMYQWSDLTTVKVEGTNDWRQQCQNGGICFKGDCICAKGFYGKAWEESTSKPGQYKAEEPNTKSAEEIFGDKRKKGRKNNGINYLEHTPEAEVPTNYYSEENGETGSGIDQGYKYQDGILNI